MFIFPGLYLQAENNVTLFGNKDSEKIQFAVSELKDALSAQNPNVLPESEYPYWPSYQYVEIEDLHKIKAQTWINEDHVIKGWDWSMPDFVEPSPPFFSRVAANYWLEQRLHPPGSSVQIKQHRNSLG